MTEDTTGASRPTPISWGLWSQPDKHKTTYRDLAEENAVRFKLWGTKLSDKQVFLSMIGGALSAFLGRLLIIPLQLIVHVPGLASLPVSDAP